MNVISVKNLCFKFPSMAKRVLNNVSFDVKKGEYVTIVGPNGSGKSTLAKLLMGLLNKESGEIYLFDQRLNKVTTYDLRKRIGIVFQNPDNQFIGATVEDDIAFGLENRSIRKEDMRDIVVKYANELGMSSFLTKEPSNLSGGQKQRVAIAGVLALTPELLILDEATSMLDPKGKEEILSLIAKIKKNNNDLTVISITHDVEETINSDRVIVLNNGEIVFNGLPKEIFSKPEELHKYHLVSPFVFEVMNFLNPLGFDIKESDTLEEISDKICK